MNQRPSQASSSSADSAPSEYVDGRSTRWLEHRQNRRAELIKAARSAVHELGPDASMAAIALHAGTSKPVFYRYFGDKTGLQHAVGMASIKFMEDQLRKAMMSPRTAVEGLQATITVYLRLARSSPNVYFFSTRIEGQVSKFFLRIAELLQTRASEELSDIDQGDGSTYARYWSMAAVGFIRNAGEKWLTELQEGIEVPTADQLAQRLSRWLVQGFSQPVTNTPEVTHRMAT